MNRAIFSNYFNNKTHFILSKILNAFNYAFKITRELRLFRKLFLMYRIHKNGYIKYNLWNS